MTPPTDEQPARSFWRRHRTALLIGVLAPVVLCAAAAALIVFLSTPVVTSARQQIAQGAIRNPAGATLHLGHYGDVDGWQSPGPSDYAVQDGMVIFPQPPSAISPFSSLNMPGDQKLSVLVYAPDGSDLMARPAPPSGRGWFYGNEWYLYNCHAANVSLWWGCMLLVGGNI